MNFLDLNPMMSGRVIYKPYEDCHELSFRCPVCNQTISIYVHFNDGDSDVARNIWKLEIPAGCSWDKATVNPSIKGHHLKRTKDEDIRCPMHVSIFQGQVILQ